MYTQKEINKHHIYFYSDKQKKMLTEFFAEIM